MAKDDKDKKKPTTTSEKSEEELHGVVLGDSFDRRFAPITLDKPRTLLPLVNIPLLDYTLELLASSGVQSIFVLCCAHADQIKKYIDGSRWSSLPGVKVTPIVAQGCKSTGDALRTIFSMNIIQNDFVLISGDVVSNMNLSNALKVHNARRQQDKSNIMTMVFKQASPSHRTRSKQDDIVVGYDRNTLQLACYENTPKKLKVALSTDLFQKHPSIQLRYDLIDCHIDICSPEVLALFNDNFDFEDLRKEFIHDIMQSDVLDYKLSTYILQGEYAARVKDLRTYHSVSKDIIHRWTFPMVPDNNFMCNTSYTLSRQMIYKERHVTLRSDCSIGEETVIGKNTTIGDKSSVSHSIVGRNVKIGNNVRINGAYIWDNVVIEDNTTITSSVICDNAVIGSHVTISRGSIISVGVKIGDNVFIEPFTKITAVEEPDGGENNEFGDEPTSPMTVGANGLGWRWTLKQNPWNELVPMTEEEIAALDYIEEDDNVAIDSSDEDTDTEVQPGGGKSSGGGSSKDTDLAKFKREVARTIKRGIAENHPMETIILEINGLKYAYDKDFMDCASASLPVILEVPNRASMTQKDFVAALKSRIQSYSKILEKYLSEVDIQVDFIFKIQDYCDENDDIKKVVHFVLHELYNTNVLEEEAILSWAEELEGDKEASEEDLQYLKQCSQLIEWLRSAEEEEEDDDEDEEYEDDDEEESGSESEESESD
ncbi:bacterial transferase hexapeptide repeat-containing protein [Heterostelium album PN500]|uniref:Translation initiation factor eIF2B subunit epsilon n=1 Tax=Heterostelium pallidum (strain ATCC 26659 / Pp 5 / PN500) TaxID=670386 RepID=D3BBS3_HETP5|nr:bacterial transferase hexapeptide repeat-containing protein [Heterostelium album PN500]EFA81106.1 bacterial transferase hexapeptide repeat-containing protein [Heterostelium album PN500]|eukprot:XP_020433224.1 bacterial transferase hexapeptide repeat-containing protein [Heterostelium album PN500]